MKNQLRVEVEPLSEQRWAKIERSLMARLDAEPRLHEDASWPRRRYPGVRTWLVAAAAVSALIVLMFGIPWRAEPVSGDHPSRITTGDSASHLALAGLTLDVAPQSAVVVGAETPQGMILVLDRGSVLCDVAPRAHDAPLIVQAGATRVRVIGTRFKVTRSGESAAVAVYQGVVEVSSAGETERVSAGQTWPSKKGASSPAASQLGDSNGAITPPKPENEMTATPTALQPAERGDEGEAKLAPPPVSPARPKSGQPTRAGSRTGSSQQAEANEASRAEEPEPKATARPSPQTVFEQATRLERSDPARASQLYRSLEAGSDSWAQNALYAHGRLQASRGNRAEARRLLERYLERFPRGSNAADARAVLRRLE